MGLQNGVGERRVWVEPVFKAHSGYVFKELMPYPPEGYRFVREPDSKEILASTISKNEWSVRAYDFVANKLPLQFLVSIYKTMDTSPKRNADITLSLHHLVFRDEPWILETDLIYEVIGWDFRMFWKLKELVRNKLESANAKCVIFWSKFGKNLAEQLVPWNSVWSKSYVVPRAVHPKGRRDLRQNNSDVVRFLFMGSANSANEFIYRGGPEVLEAFSRLEKYRSNCELVVRSEVPPSYIARYSSMFKAGRVRLIDHYLDEMSLSLLYRNSDVLVFPGHYESWVVALEAMSYGIPVIATNQWQISDIVENGRTGLLIPESSSIKSNPGGIPFSIKTGKLRRAILKGPYEDQLTELEGALVTMVDNKAFRRQMGQNALDETRAGEHSMENRNRVLKKVLDDVF